MQSLIRWDPVGHAELSWRPAPKSLCRRVCTWPLDGAAEAVTALLDEVRLPDSAELLGPVELPSGARRPPVTPAEVPVTRMLVRVRREQGLALAAELRRGVAVTSARQIHDPVRVQIDPLHIG